MSQQYDQAREYAMAQLINELNEGMGLYFALLWDSCDAMTRHLLPLHPYLAPELNDKEQRENILEAVEKIFSQVILEIKSEYPERLDQLTKENLGE